MTCLFFTALGIVACALFIVLGIWICRRVKRRKDYGTYQGYCKEPSLLDHSLQVNQFANTSDGLILQREWFV